MKMISLEVAAVRSSFACVLLGSIALAATGGTAPGTERSPPATTGGARETFSVTYTVEIEARDPTVARVRWELAGIDEIERLRLTFDPERFAGFAASGTLERRRGELLWWPEAPYGHLTYTAKLNHRRIVDKGYDSYASGDWVVSRTSALFPRSAVLFRSNVEAEPKSRARLAFRLPAGWQAATVMPADGPQSFVVQGAGRFDHPRGWVMLGHFQRSEAHPAGVAVTLASAHDVRLPAEPVVQLLSQALPVMRELFGHTPPRLLIVRAPDPMWHGGLSGEDSFYMHGDRPLRTPDQTSPYLHELFHVLAPFRPTADAHWVTEGLAEFYSLAIQRRLGLIDTNAVERGLRLFARHGVWDRDFTQTRSAALCNNSAPLLMYVLDQRIRMASGGAHGLDAVVADLSRSGGRVSTARFLGSIERIAGQSFGAFFRRHVYRGEQPTWEAVTP